MFYRTFENSPMREYVWLIYQTNQVHHSIELLIECNCNCIISLFPRRIYGSRMTLVQFIEKYIVRNAVSRRIETTAHQE